MKIENQVYTPVKVTFETETEYKNFKEMINWAYNYLGNCSGRYGEYNVTRDINRKLT